MDNQNQLVFAADGDGIGKHHAQAILSNDLKSVSEVSSKISHGNDVAKQFVLDNGGTWISGGGDEFLITAPADFVNKLEELRQLYSNTVGATLSIGYGNTSSEAGKALLAAKNRGKDQAVKYDESVEKEIEDIQANGMSPEDEEKKKIREVTESTGSSTDEDGISSSPPPIVDLNHGYDSGYKNSDPEQRAESYQEQDLSPPTIRKPNLTAKRKVEEAVTGDVPESSRLMNEELPDPKDEEAEDQKPEPRNYHGQAEGDSNSTVEQVPEENKENGAPKSMAQPQDKPSDLKYDGGTEQVEPKADIPIENATSDVAEEHEEQSMGESKHCPSCTCEDHDQDLDSLLDQHLENAKEFEDSIDDGQPATTTDLLDAHLDNQKEMLEGMDDEGISRPEDYNQKQGDMGLSEEEADQDGPNLDQVLQEGLDTHADSIQREKVIQLVGQALDGFKSQKAILDKAKDQAPELHDACIYMLKAMIELCSLAGLDNTGEAEQEVNEIEGQSEASAEQPGAEQPAEEKSPEPTQEEPKKEACPNCGHEKDKAPPKEGGAKVSHA